MSFQEFSLCKEILQALTETGYQMPTPVQTRAIPLILQGFDLLASAQTGTGKTASFGIPLLQQLKSLPGPRLQIRALILTPTRELAAQVEQNIASYGKYLPFRTGVVFGGVGIGGQIMLLKKGVDILVATPGRLLDLIGQKAVDLSRIRVLVLDEADRMLDMGFIHDMKKILSHLPKQRQTLLFSATFSKEVKQLASAFMIDPKVIETAPANSAAEGISQIAHPVDAKNKQKLLSFLIRSEQWNQVLVFTRTKHGANRLAEQLQKEGIGASAIHGNKSQGARTRALEEFKKNGLRVLVATDIAARGIDIDKLPYVVNFDLPHVAEDYVHRIGRTARAGNEGKAISFVSFEEQYLWKAIERLLQKTIPQLPVPSFEPSPALQETRKVPTFPKKPDYRKKSQFLMNRKKS